MKDLVQLTIDYGGMVKNSETMIVTKGSNAYTTMLAYAKQNDYAIDEKPYLSDAEISALKVALDWEIESLECEDDGGGERLKSIMSIKEKLA